MVGTQTIKDGRTRMIVNAETDGEAQQALSYRSPIRYGHNESILGRLMRNARLSDQRIRVQRKLVSLRESSPIEKGRSPTEHRPSEYQPPSRLGRANKYETSLLCSSNTLERRKNLEKKIPELRRRGRRCCRSCWRSGLLSDPSSRAASYSLAVFTYMCL